MPEMHFLQDLLVLFGMGVIMVVAFHRLKLPPVLGFLITGVICGPYGFKLIDDSHSVETLAEIGLVLLLFEAGIEFSVSTFLRLKKFLLIAGGLQLALTIGATVLIGQWTGIAWTTATFIGMLVSLSSTAIVLRILEHRGDIETAHGRSAFSILIFQDLCIVPFVLATPFLGGQGGNWMDVLLVVGKALLFLVLAATGARYLVPWLLNQVAKTKKREAFVLSIILLCLGTALATSHFGLSMALGAFIAGLIISESKYSHQALGEILPFREVFNCLVFVSIGMLFDVRILLANPVLVLTSLAVVLVVKSVVGAAVTGLAGHSLRVAILTGVTIAQVSEFSFVLAKLGLNIGLLDADTNQLFLAVAILSMFLTPAAIGGGHRLVGLLERILPTGWVDRRRGLPEPQRAILANHAIVIGYGNPGKTLALSLRQLGIPYIAVEHDPDVVKFESSNGTPIFYGEATRQEVLAHAGISRARLVVFTISDGEACRRGVELVRRVNPDVHIIARARYASEVEPLIAAGATRVVVDEVVSSVEILAGVLQDYLLPRDVIEQRTAEVRDNHTDGLQAALEKHARPLCAPSELSIEVRCITPTCRVAGQTLADSHLRRHTGVTVVAIQKASGLLIPNPYATAVLQPGDTAILMGTRLQLSAAKEFFAVSAGSVEKPKLDGTAKESGNGSSGPEGSGKTAEAKSAESLPLVVDDGGKSGSQSTVSGGGAWVGTGGLPANSDGHEKTGGEQAPVSGRQDAQAGGEQAPVSGRQDAQAGGEQAPVSGRQDGQAGGEQAPVSGRQDGQAGGEQQTAGDPPSVTGNQPLTGGDQKSTAGDQAVNSGGEPEATGECPCAGNGAGG